VVFLGEFSARNDNSFFWEKFGNFPLLRVKIGSEMLFWGEKIAKLSKPEN
jgi:hypothetical protein